MSKPSPEAMGAAKPLRDLIAELAEQYWPKQDGVCGDLNQELIMDITALFEEAVRRAVTYIGEPMEQYSIDKVVAAVMGKDGGE